MRVQAGPRVKGAYLLHISISKNITIKIGALGELDFKAGEYVYVGSAMNNIDKRTERHLRTSRGETEKKHWHIDYLLSHPYIKVVDITKLPSNKKEECEIAARIKGEAVLNFGCSDCKCKSHFFRTKE